MADSQSNLVAAADLEFGTKSLTKRTSSGDSKMGLRRLGYSLVFLALVAVVVLTDSQPARPIRPSNQTLPASMIPSYWQQRETQPSTQPVGEIHIEDVIAFDAREVLVLMRVVPATAGFPTKDRLECRFGADLSRFAFTAPLALQITHVDRAALLCAPPPTELAWDVNSLLIEVDQAQEIRIRRGEVALAPERPQRWTATNLMVYESLATEDDVVVFVHGMNSTRGPVVHLSADAEFARLAQFQCVFNGEFETPVTSHAQEVFRCAHPPEGMVSDFAGKLMTVKFQGRLLPSVAYYNPQKRDDPDVGAAVGRKLTSPAQARHEICACTMIYNGAKFLNEWVHYHSHLGVSKFFLYDNNSEDNLDETIAGLTERRFNVTKQPWPWVKTQEAGFSHCSLVASSECDWMFFIDVDEFFFPNHRFLSTGTESPLAAFITDTLAQTPNPGRVGQIMTFCHNYGPSGLTTSHPQGVTQGYTCRMTKPDRHKSIVKLNAVATDLSNVIHHFRLRDRYQTVKITPGVGVINHYKFQVWDEFRVKFRRRAATYVADWTESRNPGSKDRVPDLGTRAVKPVDWEKRYCEVWDYGLRNYARAVFGKYEGGSLRRLRLAWEPTS